ncbi:hypothetical protein SP19_36 [Salmonella phage 19]|nr:hypothetical protein SP19_36 [Salmonella phage 19]
MTGEQNLPDCPANRYVDHLPEQMQPTKIAKDVPPLLMIPLKMYPTK